MESRLSTPEATGWVRIDNLSRLAGGGAAPMTDSFLQISGTEKKFNN
jgi:hypothetical protein